MIAPQDRAAAPNPVRRALVHGGGVGAAMAALALARAFGRLGVEILWIDTGEPLSPDAAIVAPPDLATFHRLLGIDDRALVRAAAATINMGQQFAGWAGGDTAFLHAYGDAGTPFASLPFLQHWTRARHAGMGVALEDFCLAAAAAKQGRTGALRDPATRQAVKTGWHLDAAAYARLLREGCAAAGVRIMTGTATPLRAGDAMRLDAVMLDGQRVEADLFVDTGGALIAALDPGDIMAPPCDRLLRASRPAFDPIPLYSRVGAHAAGWTSFIPLADRTAVEFHYASAHLSDDAARAALAAVIGHPVDAAAEASAAPSRARSWTGNVVAIGGAAGPSPPLDAAEMLLLQLGVAQLVLLWPLDRMVMPEADIYNDEMGGSRARVRDFTAQHFRLNARPEPFWDAARRAPVSAELAAKIDLFAARGMFAHFGHEAHVEDGWALCMTGHGLVPRGHDPQGLAVPDQALMTEFQRQLGAVAADVRAMDSHAAALARIGA